MLSTLALNSQEFNLKVSSQVIPLSQPLEVLGLQVHTTAPPHTEFKVKSVEVFKMHCKSGLLTNGFPTLKWCKNKTHSIESVLKF
jgi:hypothetical protein